MNLRRPSPVAPRASARVAGAAGIAAVGWALGLAYLGGRRRTDYRYEPLPANDDGLRAKSDRVTNVVDFLPTGVLAATFAELGARSFPNRMAATGVRCFSGVSIGYLTAAFAPGNPGGPTDQTLRQAVHNGAGLLEYASGAAGLILFGFGTRGDPATRVLSRASLVVAVPYTIVLVGSGLTEQPEARRRLQGLLEGTLFAWITATSVSLLSR